jgi:AAHS family 4-hydroxybenzoate transporter-like MFS transporter
VSDPTTVDLNRLIDEQKIRGSTIIFLGVAILAMIADGFDISAIGFVVPELAKGWHIAPAKFASIFSAGIIGLLIGAPLIGYLGDRLGRKRAVLIGLCAYGAFTLMTMAASSLGQLMVLRFLTGVGLGGMIPNIMALTTELAPKRFRGMFAVIVLFGVPAGIAIPGGVAAFLVPHYGWRVILLIGGLLPLIIAVAVFFGVNESLKFLMQRGGREIEVRRLARLLRPDLSIGPETQFSFDGPGTVDSGASPTRLFKNGLAIITPALWVALAANQLTNFFTLSWLPTLLQSAGLSTAQAGGYASLFSLGGLAGGLILTFIIDRFGILPLIGLFILGAPLVALIGDPHLPAGYLGLVIACAGLCVTGSNFGINAAMAMIYPTPIRSTGSGWAQAMGRVGSLGAPIIGGVLLGMHLPPQQLYLAPAFALVVGALACCLLVFLCFRRFGGYRLDDVAAVADNLVPR